MIGESVAAGQPRWRRYLAARWNLLGASVNPGRPPGKNGSKKPGQVSSPRASPVIDSQGGHRSSGVDRLRSARNCRLVIQVTLARI